VSTHPLWRPFELPDDDAIARARVGVHPQTLVEVVASDERWPAQFDAVRRLVLDTLGDTVVAVEHIGSTSVPGLWAKPIVDIDLTVPDSADEASYLPALENAGFNLRVREPDWEEHRLFKLLEPDTNLHVFSSGSVEPQRHLLFRDWLRTHADDREAYAACKREVAARGFTDGMAYNNAKAGFVYDLYEKIFTADPAHAHTPQPRIG